MRIHGSTSGLDNSNSVLFDLSNGGFLMGAFETGAGFSHRETFTIAGQTGTGLAVLDLAAVSTTSTGVENAGLTLETTGSGSEARLGVDKIFINGTQGITGTCSAVTVVDGIVTACTP